MTAHDLLAVTTLGASTFQVYRVAIVLCGVVLVALATRGLGATVLARLISAVVGVILVGYGGYLIFFVDEGHLYEVYPFLFILPALVVGFHLYSRVLNREVDAAARAQLETERAARRAARGPAVAPDGSGVANEPSGGAGADQTEPGSGERAGS
ncbi:MAG TPA: hypothetical protein VH561_18220 [Micromonosporaceae bacterium]|jgi:hypothetical protein